MKFYNRERELEILKRFIEGKGTRFVVVKGLRRIGKTRLLNEALSKYAKNFLIVFIPRDETVSGFIEFLSTEMNIPRFPNLYELFKYLFEKYDYLFLDEFQNFYYMDKSAYSYIQKLFDEYRMKNKTFCLFVSGSSYSLMKKIFSDYAKALYGRKDFEILLEELDLRTVFLILEDLGIKSIEDKIKFWCVFGGIPKYYELLEILKIKNFDGFMKKIFLKNYKSLLDEGRSILVSEFGGEHKIYFTLLEAISEGKTRINEIASKFNNDVNAANRYADLLRKEYNLISRIVPLFGKKGIYRLNNNFIHFWFRFIKRYESYYEQGRVYSIYEFFSKNFNTYMGEKFEDFCMKLLKDKLIKIENFTKIGKQWGRIPRQFKPEKGKDTYEIDILAINERTKELLACECKWQARVNAEKVVKELSEKLSYVDWHKEKRKESFAIFAKSFGKRIKEFDGKRVYCFDLKDLERVFEKEIKNQTQNKTKKI